MRPRPEMPDEEDPKYIGDAWQWNKDMNEWKYDDILWLEELVNHPHVQKVIHIPLDEPIFVLRAQDKHAPKTVRYWVTLFAMGAVELLKGPPAWPEAVRDKAIRADIESAAMVAWQAEHPDKVKQPD